MAEVEAKRIRRLVDLPEVCTPADVHVFFDAAIDLVIPDFMDVAVDWSDDDRSARFEVSRCFAHDGVSALGLIDRYGCGIFERIYGWLDALGVPFTATPDTVECLMHRTGRCRRAVELHLEPMGPQPPVAGRTER